MFPMQPPWRCMPLTCSAGPLADCPTHEHKRRCICTAFHKSLKSFAASVAVAVTTATHVVAAHLLAPTIVVAALTHHLAAAAPLVAIVSVIAVARVGAGNTKAENRADRDAGGDAATPVRFRGCD